MGGCDVSFEYNQEADREGIIERVHALLQREETLDGHSGLQADDSIRIVVRRGKAPTKKEGETKDESTATEEEGAAAPPLQASQLEASLDALQGAAVVTNEQLVTHFKKYNPDNVAKVEGILAAFKNDFAGLRKGLKEKYGADI
jgi:hypothetical protein